MTSAMSPTAGSARDAAAPPVAVTVDLVALTVRENALLVLVRTRHEPPFAGRYALPGAFPRPDEDLPRTALRALAESGLRRIPTHLEQLGTYGAPDRDPRGPALSVAHLALAPQLPDPRPGEYGAIAEWLPVDRVLGSPLAFDHDRILQDARERLRGKIEYTSLATALCPQEFTITELRRVYEAVWGAELDPRNFHRKVTHTAGLLENTGHTLVDGPGRPAMLYRRGPTTALRPPLTRES